MTDLLRVLPHFPVGQYARLLPALEKHGLSTSDLLTLDAVDIGKRTNLPLLDVKRFCSAVLNALHGDLGVLGPKQGQAASPSPATTSARQLKNTAASLAAQWQTISTLDPILDDALGGGIPSGYVTEITGESGTGKTQFLLTLLLSVQLPPPHGLGRPALYISTEAPLPTRRLSQMLSANPLFQRLPPSDRPSLDNIISTITPDLESQDHILSFQVPVEIERRGIGLLVLDSVAANYRAEFERSASSSSGSNMGARTAELVRLGMHLRELAQRHNLAVVIANQVADRFSSSGANSNSSAVRQTPGSSSSLYAHHSKHPHPRLTQESPLATRSRALGIEKTPEDNLLPSSSPSSTPQPPPLASFSQPQPQTQLQPEDHPALLLDHQQAWFTGWGDSPPHHHHPYQHPLKTPSLGLVWTTQISARIALFRQPGRQRQHNSKTATATTTWRRWLKVVFAPHARESGPGLSSSSSRAGVRGQGDHQQQEQWGKDEDQEGGEEDDEEEEEKKKKEVLPEQQKQQQRQSQEGAVEFEVWMGGLRAVESDAVANGDVPL